MPLLSTTPTDTWNPPFVLQLVVVTLHTLISHNTMRFIKTDYDILQNIQIVKISPFYSLISRPGFFSESVLSCSSMIK